MRIWLCAIMFIFSALPISSRPPSQQPAEKSPKQKTFGDPCADAATDADKKPAGPKSPAERSFSSTPTPAKPAQIKVTKNATTAKWIAPNRPPPASTPTTAQSKKPCAPI